MAVQLPIKSAASKQKPFHPQEETKTEPMQAKSGDQSVLVSPAFRQKESNSKLVDQANATFAAAQAQKELLV